MTEDLQKALLAVNEAREGDSNDEEIDALYLALDLALAELGITWVTH
jgi:hypothetical protein